MNFLSSSKVNYKSLELSIEHFYELGAAENFLPITSFRKLFRCVESRVIQLDKFHPEITFENDT